MSAILAGERNGPRRLVASSAADRPLLGSHREYSGPGPARQDPDLAAPDRPCFSRIPTSTPHCRRNAPWIARSRRSRPVRKELLAGPAGQSPWLGCRGARPVEHLAENRRPRRCIGTRRQARDKLGRSGRIRSEIGGTTRRAAQRNWIMQGRTLVRAPSDGRTAHRIAAFRWCSAIPESWPPQ